MTKQKKKQKLQKNSPASNSNYDDMPGKRVQEPADPVIIGRFARPVGVKGELKVRAENDDITQIERLKTVTVKLKNGYREFNVLKANKVGNSFRISLDKLNSRDFAELLTGCEIVINATNLPTLPDSEFYIDDLIGCQIFSDENEELGFLREVWQQPHHDIWVVDGQEGEILIPAVEDMVLNVDLLKHRLTIRKIEGLWTED